MNYHIKQIRALKIAVRCMESERRKFSAEHQAYIQQGIKPHRIDSDGVTGTTLEFAEVGHRKYMELDQAITELLDLVDVLSDPGVKKEKQEWKQLPGL